MTPPFSFENFFETLQRAVHEQNFSKQGWSKLMVECTREDSLDKIRNMLEEGEDVNAIHDNKTALAVAAVSQNIDAVKLLLEFGADVNLVVQETQEPILWQLSSYDLPLLPFDEDKCVRIATILLEAGADASLKFNGFTIMSKLVVEDENKFARALVPYMDVNAKDDHGNTPLDYAIICKNTEMKTVLREAGATVTRIGNLPEPFFKFYCLS